MARLGMRLARHAARRNVERPAQGRHHIGAAAPIRADIEAHLVGARVDVGARRREQLVTKHVDRDVAGRGRLERDGERFARAVFRLVERDLQQVRRIRTCLGIEAGIERH
jgi:hypothetical protein